MLSKFALSALVLAPAALAAPLKRADGQNLGVSDPTTLVLQFAATLEALEYAYYEQGLSKFNATDLEAAGFSANLSSAIVSQLGVFRDDEKAHSAYLDNALNSSGLDIFYKSCQLNFDAALTSVTAYAAYARAFEQIGVGAYIGAAPLLDKSTLVSASTIATIEARHSSFLNILNGADYAPSPFDISLAPTAVATLVSPYITGGCDLSASLGITPGKTLKATVEGPIIPGAKIAFEVDGQAQIEGWAHIIVAGAPEAIVTGAEQAVVPEGAKGAIYVYLSGEESPALANNAATIDLSAVFAGPQLLFVDQDPLKVLGQ